MAKALRHSLSIALGVLTTTLGGCYYGDVNGTSYASGGDCVSRYGADYYDNDGYAYDDGYGYDCYDASDYGGGFAQIGFGGGWYDDYYYPGYGLWLFDSYSNRYPLRGSYLNYWGGRRAWWKHHGDGNWNRPGHGDGDGRPRRPGGWNGQPGNGAKDGDGRPGHTGGWNGRPGGDGRTGTRPGWRNESGNGTSPTTAEQTRPDRDPSAVRPRPRGDGRYVRPRPTPPTVQGDAVPHRPAATQRPARTWAPQGGGNTPRGPEAVRPRPAPSADRPAARPQAAPPSAPRYTPPAQRQAPAAERAPRFERAPKFERPITSGKD